MGSERLKQKECSCDCANFRCCAPRRNGKKEVFFNEIKAEKFPLHDNTSP